MLSEKHDLENTFASARRGSFVSIAALVAASGILSAPALAQSSQFQGITGVNNQSSDQLISGQGAGRSSTAIGSQSNSAFINQSVLSAIQGDISLGQVAGPNSVPGPNLDTSTSFTQNNSNAITSSTLGSVLSSSTTALAGRGQAVGNSINQADFTLGASSSSIGLQQGLNQGVSSSQSATNTLTAVSSLGQASVVGQGSSQVAQNNVNSAVVAHLGSSAIGLDQKTSNSGDLAMVATNNAHANAGNGVLGLVGASASQLTQTASVGVNSLQLQGSNSNVSNGASNSGQNANFANPIGVGNSTGSANVTIGNAASATTGTPSVFIGGRTGSAEVANIQQAAAVAVNSVSHSGDTLRLGGASSAFQQSANGGLSVTVPNTTSSIGGTAIPLGGDVNALFANSANGNATVSGNSNVAASSPTQLFGQSVNSVATNGVVAGTLNQTVSEHSTNFSWNGAFATVSEGGKAQINDVSQAQRLALNSVTASGATTSSINQSALSSGNSNSLSGGNYMTARTLSGVARVEGAIQNMAADLNSIHTGVVGSGSTSQSASRVSFDTVNQLISEGGAASTNGAQIAKNQTNVVR